MRKKYKNDRYSDFEQREKTMIGLLSKKNPKEKGGGKTKLIALSKNKNPSKKNPAKKPPKRIIPGGKILRYRPGVGTMVVA